MYTSFDWSDITPTPVEVSSEPVAEIMYSQAYSDAMGYLRSIMAKEEHSERVLALTEFIISKNPAHYTVWHYRLETLKSISREVVPKQDRLPAIYKTLFRTDKEPEIGENDLVENYAWLNAVTEATSKNYQIWHYRQLLLPTEDSPLLEAYILSEWATVQDVLSEDAKNYHAWTHLQWLHEKSPDQYKLTLNEELQYLNMLLRDDVYNNSAWSYRYFIISRSFGSFDPAIEVELELSYKTASLAPQNESVWNYILALHEKYYFNTKKEGEGLKELEEHCLKYAPIDTATEIDEEIIIRSSQALEVLITIYQKQQRLDDAKKVISYLQQYIPIRNGYWNYILQQLNQSGFISLYIYNIIVDNDIALNSITLLD